jgi:hypothetical protein
MTKVQKAFKYFLDLISGIYEAGWTTPEAIEDAVIEFNLSKAESCQLQQVLEAFEIHGLDFSDV